MHRKIRPSNFAGAWEMDDEESTSIMNKLKNYWKKWTLDLFEDSVFKE